jgi:uncharacterized protein YegL
MTKKLLKKAILIVFLFVILFINLPSATSLAWGPLTHEKITQLAINDLAGTDLAKKISEYADQPDYYTDVYGAPTSGDDLPCKHGHRITKFLVPEDKWFYTQKMPGAEVGAAYWAGRAREEFLKDKNGDGWKRFLGWATHYVADAFCPPHCYSENQIKIREFWEGVNRHLAFEVSFDTTITTLGEWSIYEKVLRNPEETLQQLGVSIPNWTFRSQEDIQNWIVNVSTAVSNETAMAIQALRLEDKLVPPFLPIELLEVIFARISIGIRGIYRYVTQAVVPSPMQPISAVETATVLVMDVSGSMSWQWRGGVKIESAKKAALQYIEQVANEPRPAGVTHYIGVVTFSDGASVACPLTASYDEAKKTVISLGTIASTNLGAGLDTALQELSKLPAGAKKFIILLSDGMTNTGKSREAILQTSVTEARRQGICIHTVGFGDPGDIDEDFLKKIATQSGCGSYNYASSGFELFTTYVKVRHATLGSNRFVEYKTTTPAYFLPGESITLGAFQLTAPAQELHYTVAWSGPVVLQAKLVDPQGRVVDNRYPNSVIYSGSGFSHVTVFSPIPGIWRAAATVKSAAMQPAEYYGVASARTGGYVIPYIPPPCLIQVDNTCVIPMPDLPTVVVVAIGIAVWIWWLYNQFGGFLP